MAEIYRYAGRRYVIRNVQGADRVFRLRPNGQECKACFAADVMRSIGQFMAGPDNRQHDQLHRRNGALPVAAR